MKRINKEVNRYFSYKEIDYAEDRKPAYKKDQDSYYGSVDQDLDIELMNSSKIYND